MEQNVKDKITDILNNDLRTQNIDNINGLLLSLEPMFKNYSKIMYRNNISDIDGLKSTYNVTDEEIFVEIKTQLTSKILEIMKSL